MTEEVLNLVKARQRARRKADKSRKKAVKARTKAGEWAEKSGEAVKKVTYAIEKAESTARADKTAFNQLTAKVKAALNKHRSNDWSNFLEKMGPNPLSSRPFWQKINKFRGNSNNRRLPLLKHGNKNYESDRVKSDLFSSILADTFKPNTDRVDDEFTAHVDEFVKNRTKKI